MAKTTAVQIEGLTKDIIYIREKLDEGFRITHQKQDYTNGRVLRLEEQAKTFLPKIEFEARIKGDHTEDIEFKKQKIISNRDITIALITAMVSIIGAYLAMKGGV